MSVAVNEFPYKASVAAPRPAVGFLAAAALASLVFWHFPEIDLDASALFYQPGAGFPLAGSPLLLALREFNLTLPHVVTAVALVMLVVRASGRLRPYSRRLPAPSACLFVIAAMTLGPGMLVRVLKEAVGRARPREILEFGGASAFSLPWQPSDACTDNCSFISGEGASGAALLALPLLLPARHRAAGFALAIPVGVLASINRIAFGAHFLSDVVIGWCLVLAMTAALWSLYCRHGAQFDRRFSTAG